MCESFVFIHLYVVIKEDAFLSHLVCQPGKCTFNLNEERNYLENRESKKMKNSHMLKQLDFKCYVIKYMPNQTKRKRAIPSQGTVIFRHQVSVEIYYKGSKKLCKEIE